MPKYRYIVISQDSRQHRGTIGSPDEQSARRELNELGFSVVAIEKMEDAEAAKAATTGTAPAAGTEGAAGAAPAAESGIPMFEFSAIDKNQKNVVGTIQAEDRYAAYKRLIQEYEFDVQYIVNNELAPDAKEQEKMQGVQDLHLRLEDELSQVKKKETSDEKDIREFEVLQQALQEQVEFVLQKVKEMLDQYEGSMKQETKKKIKEYVEKILRIKTSTNLEYIRKTTEELLKYLQKKEIFLQENEHAKERTKMLVEAKSMMMQLKRKSTSTKKLSITEQLQLWRTVNIIDKNPGLVLKIIDSIVQKLIGISHETPETAKLKKDIQTINNQIRQYILLFFQSKTPEFRKETMEGIKRLWQEKKRLKKELSIARKKAQEEEKKEKGATFNEQITGELLPFSGWVLAFCLMYYFTSLYINTKQIGDPSVPWLFTIFDSKFIQYFLVTLFLFHGSMSLKSNFFPRSSVATIILFPTWIIGSLLIYLNL